ncbi:MAG: hypothetical protein BJ554DRAFT_5438 [Olpidium bornovanus]|uniref:Srp40 C-terminal domain-containing protein n=1 Tax=Olpidium bornovanus TaxID=278681 RepID=A0A8H8DL16_9FUNG|nr:MAG: hypothetical protein BJ554DRAFT_5438 [Olpidium bornovanus]
MAKPNALGSFGHKAHEDLIVTRGKGFTKEKVCLLGVYANLPFDVFAIQSTDDRLSFRDTLQNKKKKGSYRGGKIDFTSNSVKFDSD